MPSGPPPPPAGPGNKKDSKSSASSLIDPEKLLGVAKLIGIDPVHESQYLWIAEECIRAEIEARKNDGKIICLIIRAVYC